MPRIHRVGDIDTDGDSAFTGSPDIFANEGSVTFRTRPDAPSLQEYIKDAVTLPLVGTIGQGRLDQLKNTPLSAGQFNNIKSALAAFITQATGTNRNAPDVRIDNNFFYTLSQEQKATFQTAYTIARNINTSALYVKAFMTPQLEWSRFSPSKDIVINKTYYNYEYR